MVNLHNVKRLTLHQYVTDVLVVDDEEEEFVLKRLF